LLDGNESYYLDDTILLSCREKHDLISHYLPPNSELLDVGANFGHFLKSVEGSYTGFGLELSEYAAKWAMQNFGIRVEVGSVDDLLSIFPNKFPAVTCWDVLEHLVDPYLALNSIASVLEDNGLLFISTPNSGSLTSRCLGAHWYYIDLEQHTILYSKENLQRILKDCGFELLEYRTLGHYYKVSYIVDRLKALYPSGRMRLLSSTASLLLSPIASRKLYLKFGDIMGLVARKC
jgi:SAM-dependent methyltransferase